MKSIRLYLKDTQRDFAKRIGVSPTTVNEIERGKREISDYVRAQLARIEMQLPDDFYNFYETFRAIKN